VYLIPASNDEDYFLTLFIDMLRKDKVHISTRCVHLINQIKQAAWDPLTLTGTTHDKMKRMENHALDAFKYLVNTIGMKPGLLNPVVPGAESKSFHVGKEWEHESYLDDEDFEKDDYVHSHVKREVLN
jgi:hypothetical protein